MKHGISTIRTFHESFIEVVRKDVISPTDVKTLENSLRVFHETLNVFRGFFQDRCSLNKVSQLNTSCLSSAIAYLPMCMYIYECICNIFIYDRVEAMH